MEVVEINTTKQNQLPCHGTMKCPCNVKCSRKYVQPPRVKSIAPARAYIPPSDSLDVSTTYHLSYLNVNHEEMRRSRSRPIRPTPALERSDGKFSDETTTKLSYKPVWNIVKTKPVKPRHRSMTGSGFMESTTTARHDYGAKRAERPEIIVPCGNIRTSTGRLDDRTTAKLSYVQPGPIQPTINFKPIRTYCPPDQPILKDTTQKLSYQPFCVQEKETYSWSLKPTYKPPDSAMCGKTTYSESFLKNEEMQMEKPILPSTANILPYGAEFAAKTIYKESYLECQSEPMAPIIPRNSISVPDGKISNDTTNKLSYQTVQGEKRVPILPRCRNMMGDGPMQVETTNRNDFTRKEAARPDPVIPCNNLRSSEGTINDDTTTKLSYQKPAIIECVQSFKPVSKYCRSAEKLDSDTVSKLSYQPWTPNPKEDMPWATKRTYEPPRDTMAHDTVYHMSFAAPGHYVDDPCVSVDCNSLDVENTCPAT